MHNRCPINPASNPFATRYVAPGELAWVAAPENSVTALAARLQSRSRPLAAIVGPHGSGKSTLLEHLVPTLGGVRWRRTPADDLAVFDPCGRSVWLVLRRRQRPWPYILDSRRYWRRGGLLILDGLEQLSAWQYLWTRQLLRSAAMGLLATCHRPRRSLPTLIHTAASVQTVQQLIGACLAGNGSLPVEVKRQLADARLVEQLLAEEQGSVREVFMRMFDLVENGRCA